MHHSVKSMAGWLWALAFLALPSCMNDYDALLEDDDGVVTHFNPGKDPTSAIFCDIENMTVARTCVPKDDPGLGIPLWHAAMALVTEETSTVGLDSSAAAREAAGCTSDDVVAITFHGDFPLGTMRCLDCEGGPSIYPDVNAACVDICRDLNGEGSDSFCADLQHAHASTNAGSCLPDLCTSEGQPTGSADPRRTPEPVKWVDLVGVEAIGTDSITLRRIAPTTPVPSPNPDPNAGFDAGATSCDGDPASCQRITKGDGYVEFTVDEEDKARVLGLSQGDSDSDPGIEDIGFGVRLSTSKRIFLVVNGATFLNPDSGDGAYADYAKGDRIRLNVVAQDQTSATLSVMRILSGCSGANCVGTPVGGEMTGTYPFRVDASLREYFATLADVRLVRIK